MSEPTSNPLVRIGGNNPPIVDIEALAAEFKPLVDEVEALREAANELPATIASNDDLAATGKIVIELRELLKRVDTAKDKTKAPILAAGKVVEGFFAPRLEKLQQIKAALEARATAWQNKLREIERQKAAAEAQRIREAEAEARRKRDEEERLVREEAARKAAVAEAEAARGRANSAAKKDAEAKAAQERAEKIAAETAAMRRQAEADEVFARQAGERDAAASAKVRTETSLTSSTAKWVGAIEDWDRIDFNELKPHFSRDVVEKAIRSYVRLHKNTRPLKGVAIKEEEKATFR